MRCSLDAGCHGLWGEFGDVVSGWPLADGEFVEPVKELGEADAGGFGALDFGVSGGAEGGDRKGHGDTVVVAGVDRGAVQGLVAGDVHAVFVFGDFGAHGAEASYDEGDAVGFFDAEFFGVADAEAVGGVRGDGGEDGEFVDELGG